MGFRAKPHGLAEIGFEHWFGADFLCSKNIPKNFSAIYKNNLLCYIIVKVKKRKYHTGG